MKKSLLNVSMLILCLLLGASFEGYSQTIKVWPGTSRGSGVTYGADVKLTMWRITNNGNVNQKFKDLGMDMVRVPIVAHWGSGDSRYNDIKTYVNSAKSKGLNIFASIANTNGSFKSNGDLDDGHGADKFPNWMKCTTSGGTLSCTTSDTGGYGVKLSKYKSYLQTVVNNKIGNVSWVGPWNEDNVNANSYSKLDWGKSIVGSELWSLSASDTEMNQVGNVIDIGGAHNYDNGSNLLTAYGDWKNFRNAGGRWFTESTLYAKSWSEGIAHMLPAISEGMQKVIIYQTVPRVVTTSGGANGTAYWATKQLIDHSKGKGAARRVEVNNKNYVAAAFKDGNNLILHVVNISSSQKTIYVNLQQGYKVNTSSYSKTKYGSTANISFGNSGAQVKVQLSGKSYVRVTLTGLSNSSRIAGLEGEVSEEIQTETPWIVFPNPSFDGNVSFTIPDLNSELPVLASVFNTEGRLILQQTFSSEDDLKFRLNESAGNYILKVTQGDSEFSKRIILK